jgi:DNA polymerase-1
MVLYLIDGHSYFYRAFHAIRELSNSRGFPTNAIYGFTNMLLKVLREKKPDAIAVVLDSPVPTERHKLYDQYKAQRPEMPSDLVLQIPRMKEIIAAFNIPTFEMPGFEADDLLATLAKKAAAQGIEVFILSGDKDMLQVVQDGIRIYDPMKEAIIEEKDVIERFGVPPSRVAEIMALMGDASDNIPGVKGVGEKTAKELLANVASLDELLEHPDKIRSDRLRNMIISGRDDIILSRSLATITMDLPVEADPETLCLKEPDWPSLLKLFTEFEFKTLIRMVPSGGHPRRGTYTAVTSREELLAFLGQTA